MREGAEIIVNGGKQLTLENQTRMASCDKMWKGIRVKNGGSLWMSRNSVNDALYVVKMEQDIDFLQWTENIFTNNYIGLYAPEGVTHKFATHWIYYNKIRSIGPLKPYVGSSPAILQNAWGYAGMWLDHMTSPLIVGGGNSTFSGLFEGLTYGIYANDCDNVTVYGNQFQNMTRSTYPESAHLWYLG